MCAVIKTTNRRLLLAHWQN